MTWQPMSTYKYPTEEWDIWYPKALFYSPEVGVVIAQCILQDQEEGEYIFTYDRDGYPIEPTHWMPLPDEP